jgi:hypothetical protein
MQLANRHWSPSRSWPRPTARRDHPGIRSGHLAVGLIACRSIMPFCSGVYGVGCTPGEGGSDGTLPGNGWTGRSTRCPSESPAWNFPAGAFRNERYRPPPRCVPPHALATAARTRSRRCCGHDSQSLRPDGPSHRDRNRCASHPWPSACCSPSLSSDSPPPVGEAYGNAGARTNPSPRALDTRSCD